MLAFHLGAFCCLIPLASPLPAPAPLPALPAGLADDAENAAQLRKMAEAGDPLAQATLGVMYRDGLGVKQDDAEALKWFRKSAEQDFPAGQVSLGWMYENGRSVKKDEAEAVK